MARDWATTKPLARGRGLAAQNTSLLGTGLRTGPLSIGKAGDRFERAADRLAGFASTDGAPRSRTRPPAGRRTGGSGIPLDSETRSTMESRFDFEFGDVSIFPEAKEQTDMLQAQAFTMGKNITFAPGMYRPDTQAGDRLLAHELAHVVQQSTTSTPDVQRDLKAYGKEKVEVLPSYGLGSATTWVTATAEAPGIRKALSALIAAGKIKEVLSKTGNISWFAAEHHKNAQLDEISAALAAAGYAKADQMARSIYDIHGEYLYSNKEMRTVGPFLDSRKNLGEKIETQSNRSMTEWEIGQARRVFGGGIDYNKVTILDGSISGAIGSVAGYARTIGNTIAFPKGSSRNMALMIHELTHVWQYQTVGWTYAPRAIAAQITEGYAYADKGKTEEQTLLDARTAGKVLTSYNKEQQGDILQDYFRRLRAKLSVSAWEPFVNDIPGR